MSTKNIVLERLLVCLELAGVPKRARNKTVAEKTRYSLSMVGKFLSGNIPLNDRFLSTVCSAYSISSNHIETGDGPWSMQNDGKPFPENRVSQLIKLVNSSVVFEEALKELEIMPEPNRWEAVAMLKRMNEGNN